MLFVMYLLIISYETLVAPCYLYLIKVDYYFLIKLNKNNLLIWVVKLILIMLFINFDCYLSFDGAIAVEA